MTGSQEQAGLRCGLCTRILVQLNSVLVQGLQFLVQPQPKFLVQLNPVLVQGLQFLVQLNLVLVHGTDTASGMCFGTCAVGW